MAGRSFAKNAAWRREAVARASGASFVSLMLMFLVPRGSRLLRPRWCASPLVVVAGSHVGRLLFVGSSRLRSLLRAAVVHGVVACSILALLLTPLLSVFGRGSTVFFVSCPLSHNDFFCDCSRTVPTVFYVVVH